MNNVNLWYAKNDEGKMVTVDKLSDDYKGKYYCPLCGSEVIPKAIESESISSHFAHMDKSKCSSESIVHWWVKHELIKEGDKFTIVTDKEEEYICKTIDIEKQYEIDDITYKPDATVITEDDKIIFIEINFTNKKKYKDYYEIWDKIGNTVVEFNAKEHLSEDNVIKINNNLKSVYYSGMIYKIDENSDDYIKYRKSLIKKQHNESVVENLKWFIDDVYKYNINKSIDIDELLTGLTAIGQNDDMEYKLFVEEMYKNNKCSNVLKDIINYRDDVIKNNLMEHLNCIKQYFKINDVVTITNSKDKKYIYERLFGYYDINICIDGNFITSMLKNKFDNCVLKSIPYGFWSSKLKYHVDTYTIDVCRDNYIDEIKKINIDDLVLVGLSFNDKVNKIQHMFNEINNNNLIRIDDLVCYIKNNLDIKYVINDFLKECNNYFDSIECENVIYKISHLDYHRVNAFIEQILKEQEIITESDKVDIYGYKFINIDNVWSKICECISNVLDEGNVILENCILIKDVFEEYYGEKITVKYNSFEEEYLVTLKNVDIKIKNTSGLVMYGDMMLTQININDTINLKSGIELIINCLFCNNKYVHSENHLNILKHIRHIYSHHTEVTYKVYMDIDSYRLYKDYGKPLSKIKKQYVSKYSDVVEVFSNDIRNDLYGVK